MHRFLCSFLTGVLLSQTVTLAADQLVGGLGVKESLSVRGAQAYSPSQIASELWTDHAVLMASRPTMPLAQYLSTLQARTLQGYRHAGYLKAEATVELRSDIQQIVMEIEEGPCFLAGNVTISGVGEEMQRDILNRVTNPADGQRNRAQQENAKFLLWLDFQNARYDPEEPIWFRGEPAPADEVTLSRIRSRVADEIHDAGYREAVLDVVVERHAGKADLLINVTSLGRERNVDKVVVKGNKVHSAEAIVKHAQVKLGKRLTQPELDRIERALWKSARFYSQDVKAETVGEVTTLYIEVREYPKAPTLDQRFSREEAALLRFRDWLVSDEGSNTDFVLNGRHSSANGTTFTLDGIYSPTRGVVLKIEPLQRPTHRANVSFACLICDEKLSVASSQHRLALEPNTLNRQLQFNVSFTLVPGQERPFRTKTSFAFKSLGEGKQRQPLSLSWAIDPVSFLAMAHEDVDRMEWDEHVLTIWTGTSRKRIDGRTGRLMDVVSEGESGSITISSSAGAFEPRVQAYLKDVDNYKQVYDPELPASSTLEFGLTTSILSAGYSDYEAFHALCTSPTVDILLKFIRLGGLRPLDDFCIEFFNWSENGFDIPFGDDPPYGFPWLALAASDQLFVRDTWPWQMWQAVSFVFAQQPTHVTDIWIDLNSREDGGPLSWLVIARFVKFLGKTLCEKAASRGLHVHSREAFLADARKLLDTRSSVGRSLRHMLFTAAKLTDEDLQTLGDFAVEQGWIRHANPVVQFARRLRQAGPTENPVIDALDEAWDDGIGAWLDNELRSLWGRDPFLDSAFPLDKANTPPSTPPWVGKR